MSADDRGTSLAAGDAIRYDIRKCPTGVDPASAEIVSSLPMTSSLARTPIHPGTHLAERLTALDMSAAELGRRIAVPTNRITGILNGQRGITGDTALRLGHFFGTSPELWLNLQTVYELRVAERKLGPALRKLPTLSDREPSRRSPSRLIAREDAP